jgi:hypothetical protein
MGLDGVNQVKQEVSPSRSPPAGPTHSPRQLERGPGETAERAGALWIHFRARRPSEDARGARAARGRHQLTHGPLRR